MESKIVIDIKYTDKDIRDAVFEIINRINRLWIVSVFAVLIIGYILYIEINNGFDSYYNGLLGLFVIAYFLFIVYFYIYPINRYIDVYKERRESTYIFTDTSIEALREEINSSIKWSLFIKACELSRYFVLMDKNRALTIIPKKFFKSESDIEELRNIINRKMKIYK